MAAGLLLQFHTHHTLERINEFVVFIGDEMKEVPMTEHSERAKQAMQIIK